MGLNYIPPPIIYQTEEHRTSFGKPYFYEYQGRIINLAASTQFYVDHMPLTSYYWPCVKVGGNSYHLTAAMNTKEEAMKFLRDITTKIESAANSP